MSFRSIFASFLKDIVNYEAPSHRSYANSSSLLSSPRIHSLLIFVIVRYVVSFATFHPNPKAPSASKKGGIGKALEKGLLVGFLLYLLLSPHFKVIQAQIIRQIDGVPDIVNTLEEPLPDFLSSQASFILDPARESHFDTSTVSLSLPSSSSSSSSSLSLSPSPITIPATATGTTTIKTTPPATTTTAPTKVSDPQSPTNDLLTNVNFIQQTLAQSAIPRPRSSESLDMSQLLRILNPTLEQESDIGEGEGKEKGKGKEKENKNGNGKGNTDQNNIEAILLSLKNDFMKPPLFTSPPSSLPLSDKRPSRRLEETLSISLLNSLTGTPLSSSPSPGSLSSTGSGGSSSGGVGSNSNSKGSSNSNVNGNSNANGNSNGNSNLYSSRTGNSLGAASSPLSALFASGAPSLSLRSSSLPSFASSSPPSTASSAFRTPPPTSTSSPDSTNSDDESLTRALSSISSALKSAIAATTSSSSPSSSS
eukprot:CAMPEP_0175069946 /NCGR_PEP_ID=MMETSP0052_2-20121109/18458_1 /TAXON_ID=51329 ORGANISM="Polytomella parva, Strain SAG 63-3" /NCGR_SAMPLE_ID=MMETSP0052_2 /ASSEMBLY_ACC=CAM_ASM_000194 /LENGTH=478 /DNA_ID=CAMNT_0016337039 /DNA_START=108 /DNA_END=1542 /DNA_ORIENTATION=-